MWVVVHRSDLPNTFITKINFLKTDKYGHSTLSNPFSALSDSTSAWRSCRIRWSITFRGLMDIIRGRDWSTLINGGVDLLCAINLHLEESVLTELFQHGKKRVNLGPKGLTKFNGEPIRTWWLFTAPPLQWIGNPAVCHPHLRLKILNVRCSYLIWRGSVMCSAVNRNHGKKVLLIMSYFNWPVAYVYISLNDQYALFELLILNWIHCFYNVIKCHV